MSSPRTASRSRESKQFAGAAGSACGIETTDDDVDHYLEVLDDFLGEVPA